MKREIRKKTAINSRSYTNQANNHRKKHRIKSKTRFTLFIICMLVMMNFATTTVLGANTSESLTKPNYSQVVIDDGDTLWELAQEYGPKNQDIRKVVRAICEINLIQNGTSIQPGQIILIPMYL